MEWMTITEVSRVYGVSTRTLRYYERIGLLQSARVADYAYRLYDQAALLRLRQILLLRRLRLSLKDIRKVLASGHTVRAVEALQAHARMLDAEITAASAVRDALGQLTARLAGSAASLLPPDAFDEEVIRDAVASLPLITIQTKEERAMSEHKRTEGGTRLTDVRIIHLPLCTVAAYHFIGENPEETVGDVVGKCLREMGLYRIKPDARMFGFNHPSPSPDRAFHGYEVWVTIPEDLEVPPPLIKKRFEGGLYAVHTVAMGDFHEWRLLRAWADGRDRYAYNERPEDQGTMGGCLEEHLNWVYHNHLGWPEDLAEGQLDLYLPVKPRS